MTLIKTLSPKSFSGPGRGHWVRSVPPSLRPPHPALPAEKSSGSLWDAAVGLTPAVGGRLGDRWALSAVPLRACLTEQGQLLLLDCGVWTQ